MQEPQLLALLQVDTLLEFTVSGFVHVLFGFDNLKGSLTRVLRKPTPMSVLEEKYTILQEGLWELELLALLGRHSVAGAQVWGLSAEEEFGMGRVCCWEGEDVPCCYCGNRPQGHWSLWGVSCPFAGTWLMLPFSLQVLNCS